MTTPSPDTSPYITISYVFFKLPERSYTATLFPVATVPVFSFPDSVKSLIEPDAETEIFFMNDDAIVSGATPVIYVPILYVSDEIFTSVPDAVLFVLLADVCLFIVIVYVLVSPLCDLQFIFIVLFPTASE